MAFDSAKYIQDKADEFFTKIVLERNSEPILVFKEEFNVYISQLENYSDRRRFKYLLTKKFNAQSDEDRNRDYNYVVHSYQPS